MESYLFVLGRTPDFSVRELAALGYSQGELVIPSLYKVGAETDQAVIDVFNELGGSTKLLKIVGEFASLTEEQLPEYIAAYFAEFQRPTFAIGEIGRDTLQKIQPADVKSRLKARGVSSRFVEGSREGLSAAVLSHQDVEELVVIRVNDDQYMFGKTLAVQDIDQWTHRDREKPYADRKKGMLPPKVARMMINLGRGEYRNISDQKPVIYDPFCGTGTVLIEAADLGYDVVGSDLDATSVSGATANLAWLSETDDVDVEYTVFQSDATRVNLDLLDSPIQVIITEPFLGKQTPQAQQLPNVFRGLEKLYLGAFRQWRHILTDEAVVVMVFPVAQIEKHRFSLESMIDKLATLGYTPTSDPVLYSRPQAVVQRQIWTFRFKKQ